MYSACVLEGITCNKNNILDLSVLVYNNEILKSPTFITINIVNVNY